MATISSQHGSLTAFGAHLKEMHPRSPTTTAAAVESEQLPQQAGLQQAESSRLTFGLTVFFQPVSRPLELSLQSSLQLSIAVLVCYRSRGHI